VTDSAGQPPTPPAAPATQAGPPDGGGEWIPKARFSEVVSERNAARDEARALGERAKAADGLALERDQAQAALAAARAEHSEVVALFRSGLSDDEGQAVARALHGRLPAEGRPALAEWIGGLRAEGAAIPKALAPYLGGQPQQQPPPKPAPATNGAPPAAGTATDSMLRAARETGNWSELRRLLGKSAPQ